MAYKPNDIAVRPVGAGSTTLLVQKKPMFLSLEWETLEQNYL